MVTSKIIRLKHRLHTVVLELPRRGRRRYSMNFIDFVNVLIFSFFEFVDDFVFDVAEQVFRRRVDEMLDIADQLGSDNVRRKWRT